MGRGLVPARPVATPGQGGTSTGTTVAKLGQMGRGGVVPARQVASRYGKKSVKNLGIEERKKLKRGTESNLQKGSASFVVA